MFPLEIPEGHWAAGDPAVGLAGVLAAAGVDTEKARRVADRRIAESRKERGLHSA